MKNRVIAYPVTNGNALNGHQTVIAANSPDPQNEWEAARKIQQSIVYMKDNLDRPLQVGTLAALANVSPSYYFALFKRQTGSAPIDYFTRLRMQQACRFLENTSLSVKEIATALGYEDPFYFSRVFKSVNHVAPTEYRSTQKNHSNGATVPYDRSRLQQHMNARKSSIPGKQQDRVLSQHREEPDRNWKAAAGMFATAGVATQSA